MNQELTPTLYQRFADSARRFPDAVALEVDDRELTYAQLHRAVEALAADLPPADGPGQARIALLASRSVVAFAGYLAALRAGAAVVPLNPRFPVERNEMICALARPDVLVADESGAGQLEGELVDTVGTALPLTDEDVLTAPADEAPAYRADLDDVAYVLFTSGSTGRPKGVPITHRNVAPYVAHNIARYGIGPGCRVSQTFDLTFDPSIFDLFVTWGGGATLVCPQRRELLSPIDYLVDRRITHWFSVPSAVSASASLGTLPPGKRTSLRQSVFIGEQLTYRQAKAWHAIAPDAPIDNVYGPTELTVACTEFRLPPDPARWPATTNDTVPIGPVYGFLDAVIVDAEGHESAEGELCVRGSQRFGGYVDEEDNRGRFLVRDGDRYVDHGGGVPGEEHFYRTGDRVRYENGDLVHIGRLDHQVKIRGYRVELGDIESVLARHPEVTQAVVIALRDGEAVRLAGCYTGLALPERQVTQWLRERLPIHMVPERLQHREDFPLNANGKVDRNALRDALSADARQTA
ncbi:amino acid adenylation domain-containing protein [Amycolatopsis sp. RTGN1]|uniref:amino acid adenylation domain-containing protein n=1 Tax=Amycolatopsis ponsaeliensis TaxID=2992142 RepID=UPI00254A4DB7|nr:amino acid adenylation domain-containing protein [Amycolatopsis sp. RTGN1]